GDPGDANGPRLEKPVPRMLEALLLFGPYFVIPFATLLAPAFIAVTFRWRMGGMRIGGASIASDFSISKAYGIYSLG
ncbi:hypothetical protein, partial [Escherichia coli]|uniref:hypothetical protein n=1 Tax=Escherichia coli TaxID=562 RepID=UPI001952E511